MKQIIQELDTGHTLLQEVPVPSVGAGEVLIKTRCSLVSQGTEKMLINFGRANLLDKARQQPERVKDVVNKMKTDGIRPTVEAVHRKLGVPLPLGYSNAGEVIATGEGVTDFHIGDRVASNGSHAQVVSVPKNLVVRVPDDVSDEEATFTVVGSIALQGIRLVGPEFGESIVVIGLGLIGLITCQLLKASGCRVIGLDVDEHKLKLARTFGVNVPGSACEDPVKFARCATNEVGADAVIITASTASDGVIKEAAQMSRKRGRIVLVGVVGLSLDRSDFYEKELTFQVSCSYGPGRYDEQYEVKGVDYPLPYVRWTERRNFDAVLEGIRSGVLNVEPLITERTPLENYHRIYADIDKSRAVASILDYRSVEPVDLKRMVITGPSVFTGGQGAIAVIGAGGFTQSTVLPCLKKAHADIKYIVSSKGLSSTQLARKYGIANSTTDFEAVLKDEAVGAVVVATRHHLHASMTVEALNAGKHVFVEKPLALKAGELAEIEGAVRSSGKSVTVGFNRRFAPHVRRMRELCGSAPGPMNIVATINAGFISLDSWVHDPEIGGGRIIGEACHFVDLLTFLIGSRVVSVSMQAMGQQPTERTDNASLHLKYGNGSLGVINYFSNGNKGYSKERVEVYYQQRNLVLDNFRVLYGYGYKSGMSGRILRTRQDKGHADQFRRWIEFLDHGGEQMIPFAELLNTASVLLAALQSMREKRWVDLDL